MTQRHHFYLSHDRSVRRRADDRPGPDGWAGRLFDDLAAEVARLAGAGPRTPVGCRDDLLPPQADRRTAVAEALSGTDVFVPLYSPGWFAKSWPRRERASFAGRYADPRMAERFQVPVLWVPWPPGRHDSERAAALRLGAGIPEYAEEGLFALCRLALYRRPYRSVVRRLAREIVVRAAEAPRPAPLAAPLDEVAAGAGEGADLTLTVAVLVAPRSPGRRAGPQEMPAAEYVAGVAERLGQPARIAALPADPEAAAGLDHGAALVLIDPWPAATPDGRRRIAALAGRLPPWALVLLVADPYLAAPSARLTATVAADLAAAGVGHDRIVPLVDRRWLVDRMPALIDRACADYREAAGPAGSRR